MTATTTETPKDPQANGTPPPAAAAAPRPPAAIVPTDNEDTSRALNAFGSAANFSHAQRMAKLLSSSSMVPQAYQGDAGLSNCIIALELAARIGASVFMVMQNLDIIHGRPGWRATFLIATVNASQRFTPLRFRWEGTRGTDTWGCRAYAKDRETGEECAGALIDWTLVKAEGWNKKAGSKWLTMPEQMFMYRAAGFWTRVYAPELSLGMQTTEEVIDTVGETVSEVVRPYPPSATAPTASLEAPRTTADLEAALRAQASKPAAPAAPMKADPTPSAQSTGTTSKPAEKQEAAPPEPCFFCKKAVGADGVDHEDSLGVIHRKHPNCTAFGPGREPGDD